MVDIMDAGIPLITTLHHPITFDRKLDLAAAPNWRKKLSTRRWYGFLQMQGKVARRAVKILSTSESSARDLVTDFGVDPERIQVIPPGAAAGLVPPSPPRVTGRIDATPSADAPPKGAERKS